MSTLYDANGNLLAESAPPCPAPTYQWDAENRLGSINGGAVASYVYDALGRRVKRTANGATTLYLHDGGSVLSEFSNPSQRVGTWLKDYIYLGGQLLATESATDGTRYHFSDHLGTSRVMTQSNGTVCYDADYYPYGKEITASTDGETHKFTGKERDTESGLDFFGARYYSSAQGRYLSADWSATPVPVPYADFSSPQSLNLYSYVGNNPLNLTDPDGHCCSFSASSIADWVDDKIDTAVNYYRDRAVASGSPGLAAAATFTAGATGDVGKGFTNLLRTGESVGSLPENASAGQVITAVAEEGGRVGGTILVVTAIGARANAPSGNTLRPGPNAEGSVPASGTRITTAERAQVNQLGNASGCHSCGASTPGTSSGNWVGDHQPPTALANGRPQALYPQCLSCSNRQGGQTTAAQRAGQQYPPPQPPPVVPRRPEEKP
jgi:RHS repeat-associated protein